MELLDTLRYCIPPSSKIRIKPGSYTLIYFRENDSSIEFRYPDGVSVISISTEYKISSMRMIAVLVKIDSHLSIKDLKCGGIIPFVDEDGEGSSECLTGLVNDMVKLRAVHSVRTGNRSLREESNLDDDYSDEEDDRIDHRKEFNNKVRLDRKIDLLARLVRSLLGLSRIDDDSLRIGHCNGKSLYGLDAYKLTRHSLTEVQLEIIFMMIMGISNHDVPIVDGEFITLHKTEFIPARMYSRLILINPSSSLLSEWFGNEDPITYVKKFPCWDGMELNMKIDLLIRFMNEIYRFCDTLDLGHVGRYVIFYLGKGLGLCA